MLVSLGVRKKECNIRTPQEWEKTEETENREATIYEVLEVDTTTETSEHAKKTKTLHFNRRKVRRHVYPVCPAFP